MKRQWTRYFLVLCCALLGNVAAPVATARNFSMIDFPGASARYLAGTTAPNTFSLVRFTPVAGGVRVGATFEDLAGPGRATPVVRATGDVALPGSDLAPEGATFTLRTR